MANERSSSPLSISCIEKASSLRRMPRTAAPPREMHRDLAVAGIDIVVRVEERCAQMTRRIGASRRPSSPVPGVRRDRQSSDTVRRRPVRRPGVRRPHHPPPLHPSGSAIARRRRSATSPCQRAAPTACRYRECRSGCSGTARGRCCRGALPAGSGPARGCRCRRSRGSLRSGKETRSDPRRRPRPT